MKMYCSKCGAQILDSASFCTKCGNAVNRSLTVIPATPKRHIFKKIISVVIALSIVAVGAYFVYDHFCSGPEKTLKKFENAMNSGDLNGMIECMDPSVQAAYKGVDFITEKLIGFKYSDFAAMAPFLSEIIDDEDMPDLSDLPKMHIDVKSVDYISDNRAVVYAYVEYGDDSGDTEIPMEKHDDTWYLSRDSKTNLF